MSVAQLQAVKTTDEKINELAQAYQVLKEQESHLKVEMQTISDQLVELVGTKEEGSVSAKTDAFKVTVTGKLNRSLDADKVQALASTLPAPLYNRLFKFKPSLDLKEMRYVQNNEPDFWAHIAPAITAKPGKPSLKVEMI